MEVMQGVVIECPQCGAPIQMAEKTCLYCKSAVYIKKSSDVRPDIVNKYIRAYQTLLRTNEGKNVEGYIALGICHLQNNMFDAAFEYCERAIALLPEDGEAYYYAALALLKNKRPYLHTMSNVKKIISLLEAAISLSPTGKYYYLLYLIQIDFFDKKKLRNGKVSDELLAEAQIYGLDNEDIAEIKNFAGYV